MPPIGEHAPQATTLVTTADLHRILAELASARRFVASCGRMNREDKIALYSRLSEIDKIASRNLQLSLFSPEQRSQG
jgi:hypothetical protein